MSNLVTSLPEPRFAPLRGGPVLRWGVLAPGAIATAWVQTVHANTDQRVVAVASRTASRAEAFATEHGIPRSYGSYQALVADPDIDIVYVAAPHSEHRRLALLAIAAGKHVLVEKPLALNAIEAAEIATAARLAGVFAMEAMWSRFLPQTDVIGQLLADGALGDVLTVTADFGTRFPFDPTGRAFNPALGGGALLDIGIYPIWFAHFVLGSPHRVTATGSLASTGVDAQAALVLDYDTADHAAGHAAAQAVLTTSMLVATPITATVCGTAARIQFDGQFVAPSSFRLLPADDSEPLLWPDRSGLSWRDGLCYQATAVACDIANGLTESPLHSLDDSIAVLSVIDQARAQLGAV